MEVLPSELSKRPLVKLLLPTSLCKAVILVSTLVSVPRANVPSISALPLISKVTASSSPLIVIFLPPVMSLLESVIIALLAITVPFVIPSIKLISVALAVTPSRIFNSDVVNVAPSRIFNSDVLSVAPSSLFNSAAVEDTVVPSIDRASVSKEPSISTLPDMSRFVNTEVPTAVTVPANVALAPLPVTIVVVPDLITKLPPELVKEPY